MNASNYPTNSSAPWRRPSSLRKTPKLLVEPDVAIQPGDGAGASEAFAIGTAARLIFQSAAQEIFADNW